MALQNPDETISQYLSDVPTGTDPEGMPLREAIKTPIISKFSEPHVRIIDFGGGKSTICWPLNLNQMLRSIIASWRDRHLSELIQSPALQAPEVTIGAPWDSSVDIWSLGCLVGICLT